MTSNTFDSAMITALTHEIKNPTALALAHVELMRLDLNDAEAVNHHLAHIQNALTDITELTQEMLLASQLDIPSYEMDIHDLLGAMLSDYQAAWPGISFSFMNRDTSILFHCQAQLLRLIVSNLLKNAVEAVNAVDYTRHVIVTAEVECERLCISICDNGRPSDYKPHGNGLGLTICHQLAARMNGTVDVSLGENGGCIAKITLCPQRA